MNKKKQRKVDKQVKLDYLRTFFKSNEPPKPPKKKGKNKLKEKNSKQIQQQKREVKKKTVEPDIIEQADGEETAAVVPNVNDEEPDEEIEKVSNTIFLNLYF